MRSEKDIERLKQNKILWALFRTFSWTLPLAITIFFIYAFISYNIVYCYWILYQSNYYYLSIAYSLIFNIFLILAFVSFIKAVFTEGGLVPPSFSNSRSNTFLEDNNEENQEQNEEDNNENNNNDSDKIICKKCKIERPVRAHHCHLCGVCKLRMDHHCPALNNCVGFYNYKFFVLLLTHASILSIWAFITILLKLFFIPFTTIWSILELQYISWLAISFGISTVLVPFAVIHFYLIIHNTTTLEHTLRRYYARTNNKENEYTRENIYDIGKKENFIQVFGENWLLWFLPVFTSIGDGCSFPTISGDFKAKNAIDNADVSFLV